jgi:hypothetical protein
MPGEFITLLSPLAIIQKAMAGIFFLSPWVTGIVGI